MASVQKLAQEMNEGLKDQALDTERKETRKPDARRGFMKDEEEVGDKAAIGDGDGNGRVITRISEGKSIAASQS